MRYLYLFFTISIFSTSCTQYSTENNVKNFENKDSIFIEKSAQNTVTGRVIFKKLCSSCHNNIESGSERQFVNIFKIYKSMGDEHFFEKFIADSKYVKKNGSAYALNLEKRYNSGYEHLFKDSLTKNDVNNLIIYLKKVTTDE